MREIRPSDAIWATICFVAFIVGMLFGDFGAIRTQSKWAVANGYAVYYQWNNEIKFKWLSPEDQIKLRDIGISPPYEEVENASG